MKTLLALAVCAGMFGFSTVAHALQIASPAIFGSHQQDRAQCVIYNAGTGTLTVTIKILTESGAVQGTVGNCGSVAPGDFCSKSVAIDFGVAYACVATAGAVINLRGALVIQEQKPDGSGGTYTFGVRSAPLK